MSKKMTEDKILSRVDEGKRDAMRSLVAGTAFAVPMIASFSMSGLKVNEANAYTGNQTF